MKSCRFLTFIYEGIFLFFLLYYLKKKLYTYVQCVQYAYDVWQHVLVFSKRCESFLDFIFFHVW